MYVAKRCPPPYILDRLYDWKEPPREYLDQFLRSIEEALRAMGVVFVRPR